MKKFYSVLIALIFGCSLNAQHDHAQCGMTAMDQQTLLEFVEEFNNNKHLHNSTDRADKLNVPIKFHVVRRSNGTGGVNPPTLVYDQFERMRKDFIAADMNLYLYENSFNYINNTAIYENPGSASNTVQNAKDKDALNIFITENANTSSGLGTVLGFYDPNRDYIIIRITDVAAATSSLSHELGHMFSLPHTFFGWESEPYNEASHGNPCMLTMAPGSGVPVELVDGSNCLSAADRICDTPPDYNFGFTSNGCTYNQTILDRNSDLIEPMIDNYMGYFIGCDEYVFTQGQIDIMRANWALNAYNGNDRSFLRSDYVPTSDTVSHDYQILSPAMSSTTDFSNSVLLDWEDADGAQAYQVDYNAVNTSTGQAVFESQVVTESQLHVTTFEPGVFVNWTVKPFNESYGGAPIRTSNFFVGTEITSTDDLNGLASQITVGPNPVPNGSSLTVGLDLEASSDLTFNLHNVTGQLISTRKASLSAGYDEIQISTVGATPGLYLLEISTGLVSTYRKIVVE